MLSCGPKSILKTEHCRQKIILLMELKNSARFSLILSYHAQHTCYKTN